MTETLIGTFKPIIGSRHPIESVLLIPSSNGRFEVTLDEQLVYSKAATGKHTNNEFIVEQVRARLK